MSGEGADHRVYAPLNTLKPLAPGLWLADGPLIRFYGMPFPTRMVVARVADGLWLHSPIAWEDGLATELAAEGPVTHLIAPNPIHYAFLPGWAACHPDARVWAAPGVAGRAASHDVAFPEHTLLGNTPPAAWAAEIDQRLVPGHPFLHEAVFFHRASRTLIVTDLIENFEAKRLNWPMRLAARMAGILAPDGKTPLDARLNWHNRGAARAVIEEVIAWRPERIVMAHGAIIDKDAPAHLERAFGWLTGA